MISLLLLPSLEKVSNRAVFASANPGTGRYPHFTHQYRKIDAHVEKCENGGKGSMADREVEARIAEEAVE